jgi:nicotinamide-nucleotide adenylyltransferase
MIANINTVMLTVRKCAPSLLERLQNGLSHPPIELVHAPHPLWPFRGSEDRNVVGNKPLRISILDSSFNPPTLAHLALINSQIPQQWRENSNNLTDEGHGYDAKLLLLSVKNADKTLMPGDATYLQRLEMMSLLTKSIHSDAMASTPTGPAKSDTTFPNVAIAITSEPTFVGKSVALLAFLKQRLSQLNVRSSTDLELTFLVGLDTLKRLFSPHYYSSEMRMTESLKKFLSPLPAGDNSRVVAAERPSISPQSPIGLETKASILLQDYERLKRIATMDIGGKLSVCSSSAVRDAVALDGSTSEIESEPVWRKFVTTEIADYIREQRLYVNCNE